MSFCQDSSAFFEIFGCKVVDNFFGLRHIYISILKNQGKMKKKRKKNSGGKHRVRKGYNVLEQLPSLG